MDRNKIARLMEVSALLYKCTYCVFTLYGRSDPNQSNQLQYLLIIIMYKLSSQAEQQLCYCFYMYIIFINFSENYSIDTKTVDGIDANQNNPTAHTL